MFPRSPSGFTDIKIANVFHHPVQAYNMNFNPQLKYSLQSTTKGPGLEVIKLFSYSTLSTKFILLINVKMPTIVGI